MATVYHIDPVRVNELTVADFSQLTCGLQDLEDRG